MPASTTYTDAMIAELKAQSPLNHAKAKALAGRGLFATRSVQKHHCQGQERGNRICCRRSTCQGYHAQAYQG